MNLSELVQFDARIAATSTKEEKEAIIRQAILAGQHVLEAETIALYLSGQATRNYDNLNFGIKETFLGNDLCVDSKALEDIIEAASTRFQGTSSLSLTTINEVFVVYLTNEDRSTEAKSAFITKVLDMASTPEEVSFLFRLIVGKMRNGIGESSIIKAFDVLPTEFALNPDLPWWINEIFHEGKAPKGLQPELFRRIQPQLCARNNGDLVGLIESHGGSTIVQPKHDGMRINIHAKLDVVQLFTRQLEDVSENYHDLVEYIRTLELDGAILDGELVAMTFEGDILPFGTLQKRLGKRGKSTIRVGIIIYDVLYMEGVNAIHELPYITRMERARAIVKPSDPFLQLIDSEIIQDPEALRERLLEVHEAGKEGLVCKNPLSCAVPGGRSNAWVKLKPDYIKDDIAFGDSMDLVVIGYNKGRGRRHGKVGALWVGIPDGSLIHPIGKVGTGLNDAAIDWWTEKLTVGCSASPLGEVVYTDGKTMPERFVNPEHIVEIKAAEVNEIDYWGGLSLRFPRYLRLRDDKGVDSATMLEDLLGDA